MLVILMILFCVGIILAIPLGITAIVVACVKSAEKKKEQGEMPAPVREKLSASAIMLLIGTAFIVLAAITFVAANWLDMTPSGRVFALLAESALGFGISVLLKKVIGLNRTSMAFYMIGTIIAVTSFITAGYYELLGEWFSLRGNGEFLFCGVSAIAVASASFAAVPIYKSKSFNYIGTSFVSLAVIFFCGQPTESFRQFAFAIAVVQMIMTAVIHFIKPQKGTEMERPVVVIGDISAVVYQFIAGLYVFITTLEPNIFTFAILMTLLAQLAVYGKLKHKKWMFIYFNLVGLYAGMIISGMVDDSAGMILFAFITLVFFLVNRVIPNNLTACHVITLIGAVIGSIVSLSAGDKRNYMICIIVPAITSLGIASYSLNKNKSIQTASGLFSPVLPFITAVFLKYIISDNNIMADAESSVLVYGILAFVYMAVSALFIFLPKISFNFHANHPLQSQMIIYVNMIAATAILLNISKYSQLFMIPVVLCILHFAVSYAMTCNITAAGSVISLIMIINSVLKNRFSNSDNARMYIMFGLFVLLIIISRILFPDGFSVKTFDKTRIDVILLSSWTAVMPFPMFNRVSFFIRTISLAVFLAGFIKKKTDKDNAAFIMSVSATLACIAFMTRPFLTPESSMIASKVNIGIFALLGTAYKYIWKNHPYASKVISTVIFIISFASLIIDGIIFSSVANKIFVLAVTAGILILSFFVKSKTWFTASSVALVVMTVFSTYRYFNSAGWWIYLLAVGVIFITIASINEVCRKNGESMKSTFAKKFSDWKW